MHTPSAKIAALMYHEVSVGPRDERGRRHMTPQYDIDAHLFGEQIQILSERCYRTVLLNELSDVPLETKRVILTFDDGLEGNRRNALPILKKFGCRGTFFIAVGSIGTPRFMDWRQLMEMASEGMSIQSHTVSHRPLELLDEEEIRKELRESKLRLEDKLGTEVYALSFPHGSYNAKVIEVAQSVGYRYLCSSDVRYNDVVTFDSPPVMFGRLAVTKAVSAARFAKWIECDAGEAFKARFVKDSKNFIKRLIGIDNYRRLYRKYFGIVADGPD